MGSRQSDGVREGLQQIRDLAGKALGDMGEGGEVVGGRGEAGKGEVLRGEGTNDKKVQKARKRSSSFVSPLPDRLKPWGSSPLREPSCWDGCLQALATTISKFDYPAAIFWGHELVLLYNQAWINAGGIREQGQSQRGSLSPDAWSALNKCMSGGRPSRIMSHALLRESEKPDKDQYTVLASPLFGTDAGEPRGVIAQMIRIPAALAPPKGTAQKEQDRREGTDGGKTPQTMGDRRLDQSAQSILNYRKGATLDSLGVEPSDNTPLDEHPFFHRFAEMLPTGLAILDHKAQAVFVNQHFYQLTTHMGDDKSFKSWPQSIHPDDYERVMGAYQDAFNSQTQLRAEFRALGSEHPWRLLLLTPLGDENLKHVSLGEYGGFICSVVDITSEKSAELGQRQTAEEATDRKKQQERFIDMVSHEIRNPLSAMVHCVEDIRDALHPPPQTRIDTASIAEALETVDLCISHQKNIVDDVLSFSKLDSSMLALSPVPCRPSRYLRKTLNMFSPQFRKHAITFDYRVDAPYTSLDISWTMADLSRIGQVLINLITNAIKFTSRGDGAKSIVCKVSASTSRPTSYPPDVVFFSPPDAQTPSSGFRLDATERPEWGTGSPLYILVALVDTGIGISQDGQSKLFERFRQATPKTGEIYGGSGLGLNISRKLVQLHGGEIGVSSQEGKGATFGFFFRVRRSDPPAESEGKGGKGEGEGGSSRASIAGDEGAGKEEEGAYAGQTEEQAHQVHDDARELQKVSGAGEQAGQGAGKHRPALDEGKKRTSEALHRSTSDRGPVSKEPEAATPEPSASEEAKPVGERAPESRARAQETGRKEGAGEGGPGAGAGAESARPQPLAQRPKRPRHKGQPVHVLLVEDNAINQRIVARKLGTKPYLKVSVASNGREAVGAVATGLGVRDVESGGEGVGGMGRHGEETGDGRKEEDGGEEGGEGQQDGEVPVDVILMDQEMPVMDGNAAARAIRELEEGLDSSSSDPSSRPTARDWIKGYRTPILGVSANVRQEQLEEMLDCGMDGWITKPYKIEEMVGRIAGLVGVDFDAESSSFAQEKSEGDGEEVGGERERGGGEKGSGGESKEVEGAGKAKEDGAGGEGGEEDEGSWTAKLARRKESKSLGNGNGNGNGDGSG